MTQTINNRGEWVPAIPLPFYGLRKICECGNRFWFESNYEKHYIVEHIYHGNHEMILTTPDQYERKLTLQMARSLIVAKNAEHPTHNLLKAIQYLDKEI